MNKGEVCISCSFSPGAASINIERVFECVSIFLGVLEVIGGRLDSVSGRGVVVGRGRRCVAVLAGSSGVG